MRLLFKLCILTLAALLAIPFLLASVAWMALGGPWVQAHEAWDEWRAA